MLLPTFVLLFGSWWYFISLYGCSSPNTSGYLRVPELFELVGGRSLRLTRGSPGLTCSRITLSSDLGFLSLLCSPADPLTAGCDCIVIVVVIIIFSIIVIVIIITLIMIIS